MNKKLKRIICIIAFGVVIFATTATNDGEAYKKVSETQPIEELKNNINEFVPKLQKRYGVPGTAIGIVEKGKLVYVLNYGFADKKEGKTVNDDTTFQIASISKSVAAWGIMHLVEEGKIGIDDPVEKYLTRWHIPDSKFNKNDVTVRGLLSHTAGISVHGYGGTDPTKEVPTLEQSLSDGVVIKEEPNSKFMYSGGGYTILQLLIEEVTKLPFDKYMEDEVLKPLGMVNSSYSNNLKGVNISCAYGSFGQKVPNYNFTESAAAGLNTTVKDFSKFIIESMNINNGEVGANNVINIKSIELMFTPVKEEYGLGVIINKLSDGNILISHSGGNCGWRSQFAMIPNKKDGIIIFTNSEYGADLSNDILNLWEEHETGEVQQVFKGIEKSREIVFFVSIAIGVLLSAYIINFALGIKKGSRMFISGKENKSIIRLGVKLGVISIIGFAWVYILYNLSVISFMPYGFKWISYLVLAWIISFICFSFFPKIKPNEMFCEKI